MKRTKRILSMVLVIVMLFTSLPMDVFAQETTVLTEVGVTEKEATTAEGPAEESATTEETITEEVNDTVYETGKSYVIDGVEYYISQYETVCAVDSVGDPEKVEILSELGNYPVTKMGDMAFNHNKALKEIIIPESVEEINGLLCPGIEKIEIRGGYKKINNNILSNSAFYKNEENWKDGLLIVDGYLIGAKRNDEVILGEDITSISEDAFDYDWVPQIIRIQNKSCVFPYDIGVSTVISGFSGSTAEKYAKKWSCSFKEICGCEDAVLIPGTPSYCNGTIGHTEGKWCEKCQLWQYGSIPDSRVNHFDEDNNTVCDYCGFDLTKKIIYGGFCDDAAFWTISEDGTLHICGNGSLSDLHYTAYDPWEYYRRRKAIKTLIVSKGITSIADANFTYQDNLETVILDDTVKGLPEFRECKKLKNVSLGNGATEIPSLCFADCSSLEELVLPKSLKKISYNAFSDAVNLKKLVLPDTVESIGSSAFSYCTSLAEITLNDGLTRIDGSAFYNCKALKSVELPDSLTSLGSSTFKNCSSLEKVKLSKNLETLIAYTFENCSSLKEIFIPEKIKKIDSGTFTGCTSLANVDFETGYVSFSSSCFSENEIIKNPENIRDGFLFMDNCLMGEIESTTETLVLGEEVTAIAGGWSFRTDKVKEVIIYNKACVITSPSVFKDVKIYGLAGSTTEEAFKNYDFNIICLCDEKTFVPESEGYCNGVIGYTDGYWCDSCKIWTSGHEKKAEINHVDENADEICDLCSIDAKIKIIDTGKIGENNWWILDESYCLYVLGTGAFAPSEKAGFKAYNDKIKKIIIGDEITSIGNGSFANMTAAEEIVIGKSVIYIKDYAFKGCTSVEKITMPVILSEIGRYAFSELTKLKEIDIPDTVYKIGDYAFYKMSSLEEITVPASITNWGQYVFRNCTSLKRIFFDGDTVSYGAFYGCTALSELNFKNEIKYINTEAFYGCTALTELSIKAKTIDSYAFSGCAGIKEAYIETNSCGYSAFSNCTALEKATLKGIKNPNYASIKTYVFSGCSSLTDVTLPSGTKVISSGIFSNCTSLSELKLPESITTIGSYAFQGCTALENIVLSEKVTNVNTCAFRGCSNLGSITFLNSATAIAGPYEDYDKTYLTIPSTTVLVGHRGSTADFYADEYSLQFLPINDNRVLKNIKIASLPTKTVYVIGKDTEFDFEGLKLRLEFTDGSVITVPRYYTVETNGCDLTKCGPFELIVKCGEFTDTFKIFVNDKIGTPETDIGVIEENGQLEAEFNGFDEVKIATFIPKETNRYCFIIEGDFSKIHFYDAEGNRKVLNGNFAQNLTKGEEYKIYIFGKNGKVSIKNAELFTTEKLPDGTYKITKCYDDSKELVVPSNYNGKVITAVGADLLSYRVMREKIVFEDGIKTIEPETIKNVSFLEEVVLPDTLEEIPDRLFYECRSLKTVTGGRNIKSIGEYAFYKCGSLSNYEIPDSVDEIKKSAFYSCQSLYRFNLSQNIREIGDFAFGDCGRIQVTFDCANAEFGSSIFVGADIQKIEFGSGVKVIPKRIFYSCSKLENVIISDTVERIEEYAFEKCTNLTEIVIPSSVKTIGDYAFKDCKELTCVTFNEGLEEIGEGIFENCKWLQKIEFPASLKKMGSYTFRYNEALKEVTFKGYISELPNYTFENCEKLEKVNVNGGPDKIGNGCFMSCEKLLCEELIPIATYIGNNAFYGCTQIKNITLHENIEYLGGGAFALTNAESVIIPKGITTIPGVIFYDSDTLKRVEFLGEITEIGSMAFCGCNNLTDVIFTGKVKSVGERAFSNCSLFDSPIDLEDAVYIGEYAFQKCERLNLTAMPTKTCTFGEYAFYKSGLSGKLDIPESSKLYMHAFDECKGITEVILGENTVVNFGGQIFKNCTGLEKVTVCDGVELYSGDFDGCSNLTELHFKNTSSPVNGLGKINENATIFGYKNSNAHAYAIKHGYKFVQEGGEMHVHSFTQKDIASTECFGYNKKIFTCTCGYNYTESTKIKTHIYSDYTIDKEPTCTDPGLKSKKCQCGLSRVELTPLPPLGHTEVIDIPAVAPTETSPGYTHQSHCSVCGETVVKRELIGHSEYDIKINNETVIAHKFNAATNDKDGENTVIIFEQNNDIYLSYIDKTVIYKVGEVSLSKTEFVYNGKNQTPLVTVKDSKGEALVLNRDYKLAYSADSKYCGEYSVKVDYIGNYAGSKTLNYDIVHNWGVGKITKSSTCTKTGIKTFTCGCGDSYTETVAKLRHSYSNACDTTCNRSGCGAKRSITHSYKNVTTKATLTKNGNIQNKCSVCGKVSKTATIYCPKTFTLSTTAYTYNGKVKTPSVTVKDSMGNILKKNTDYTVSYESGRKAPGKYTVKITFKGKYEGIKRLYFTIAPKATSKITASQTTSTITLKWSKIAGADGYRVYQYNAKTKRWVKVKDVTGTSLKMNKLTAGTKYKFRVKAYTKDDGTIWGAYSSTFETATKCKTPSIIKLTTTKGKASFTWSNVSGESGYQVYYSTKKDSGYKKVASYKANVVKGSKSKLTSGKKYYFKVRAYKKVNGKTIYGSFSTVKNVKIK
ncbi:MAG: leucine-rich repeat protein [Clostridia bacterium]|nr:leucine-rich repeat protein [Clostridia bacterium]